MMCHAVNELIVVSLCGTYGSLVKCKALRVLANDETDALTR